MESNAVIEGFDVIEDGGASCGVGGEAMMVDQFVFERAPEGFDESVVVAVAFAAHGSEQAVLSEYLAIGSAGELTTAIGVDDELCRWLTSSLQGHAQSGDDELSIEDLMHGPADHTAGEDIQDRDQIQPTLAGEDAGGVGRPHLVRPFEGKTFKRLGAIGPP